MHPPLKAKRTGDAAPPIIVAAVGLAILSLVPIDAYEKPYTYLGYSRRSILLINDPAIARDILTDPLDIFPKNDLMVGALEPLVGDSIFVSSGERWRRQRAMIDPIAH